MRIQDIVGIAAVAVVCTGMAATGVSVFDLDTGETLVGRTALLYGGVSGLMVMAVQYIAAKL